MSASGLKLSTLTEAEFLRNRIADFEASAEEFERMREGPLDDVVRDRVAMIAADFHEQAEKYRAMLTALEAR